MAPATATPASAETLLTDLVVRSMGRVEQIGKPQDIRAKHATEFLRDFITA